MATEAELLDLVREASIDRERTERLESVLFSGGLSPHAPAVVGALIEYATGTAADAAGLLLTAIVVIEELPEPTVHTVLLPYRQALLELLDRADPETTEAIVQLFGWFGHDSSLAARLQTMAGAPETGRSVRPVAMASSARLDPKAAALWLPAELDGPWAVAALDAMRVGGLAPAPSSATALVHAWVADPEQADPHSLAELVRYVADETVLTAIADTGDNRARADVATALRRLHTETPLSAALTELLFRLLDDSDVDVRRRAYQVVVFDPGLARQVADRLATDLAPGEPARPGAMYALITIGDDRWQPWAGVALAEGWSPPNLPAALVAADLPWQPLREGVLRRIETLVSETPMPIKRRVDELRDLLVVLSRADDSTADEDVRRLLSQADSHVQAILAVVGRRLR